MPILLLLNVLFWSSIALLAVITMGRWYLSEKKAVFLAAGGGSISFLLAVFKLPWLNLQPLKMFGLDWLIDLVPILQPLLGRWGLQGIQRGVETIVWLDPFFEPRGWLNLLLVGANYPSLTLFVSVLGVCCLICAFILICRPHSRYVGISLMILSGIHLLILFYFLPDIDGLGESAFPGLISLMIPLLGARLEWWGPLTMMMALCLMFWAGAQAESLSSSTTSKSEPVDHDW